MITCLQIVDKPRNNGYPYLFRDNSNVDTVNSVVITPCSSILGGHLVDGKSNEVTTVHVDVTILTH